MENIELGSLFDGIGGFPLAATLHGITPVWASEIEKFPIEVTKIRFPSMKHLGDITQINGAEIEPVDIITFGSPCQDLSVAGKREGLVDGKRSNLFYQAVRIIREMREATNGNYPTFAVWENVPGAFSSNGGQDFRSVLEEITESEVPMPQSGKWATAGMVRGNGRSAAWRILDAQYWGVPQRRKRIFLVADFTGQRAGEILLEQQGLPWNLAESRNPDTLMPAYRQRYAARPYKEYYDSSAWGLLDHDGTEDAPDVAMLRASVADEVHEALGSFDEHALADAFHTHGSTAVNVVLCHYDLMPYDHGLELPAVHQAATDAWLRGDDAWLSKQCLRSAQVLAESLVYYCDWDFSDSNTPNQA